MKRLILVRHGKSSWDYDVKDIDRPLKKRAFSDAEHVISAFKAHMTFEINAFSSPAKRARTTAKLFKSKLEIPNQNFEIIPELYTFNSDEVLNFIRHLNNDLHNIMLFGHNPAYTHLVNLLGNLPIDNLPTTGLVSIEFDTDSWKTVEKGTTHLYLFPKHLR